MGEKPEEGRRSKPRGAEGVRARGGLASLRKEGDGGEVGVAAAASAERSDGERVVVVVRAQWI